MQQPLVHLYFLTVLEHLLSRKYTLSNLVKLAEKIQRYCESPSYLTTGDQILLWIELQALTQAVAQKIPHLLSSDHQAELLHLKEPINR